MTRQTVLITGALSGIGRATAFAFAKEKANIVVSGRRNDDGKALAIELRGAGAEAEFIRADVRREDDVCHLVGRAVERFGRLDVAVNNAGTEGHPGPITSESFETYMSTFETNVFGLLLCMKYELLAMKPKLRGSIVNVSSIFGKLGAANASVYCAAKHAVEGLTKSGALEAAEYGVRVNAVAPGPVSTPLLHRFANGPAGIEQLASTLPMRRLGQPEEIADTILFIASDRAAFITGQSFAADGGRMAG